MAMPFSEDPYSPENAFVPPTSTSRIVQSAWDSGFEDRETNIIAKMQARESLSKVGEKISPAKLNEQFKGLNADREMTAQEAQFVFDGKEEKRKRDAIVGSASGFWQGTALPFVVGAASSMADPIGFGIGAFTGWGLGKVVTKAAGGVALKGASKFALDAVDNTIGNSVAEGLVWKDREETFEEYTTKDFLTNAVGGAVIMTGAIHGGAKILKSAAKVGDKYLRNTQQVVDTLIDNEKNPDAVGEILKVMDKAITHTDESNIIIKESFGDEVEVGETLVDTAANIRKAVEEERISETDVEGYISRVLESDVVDDRAVDLIDSEYSFTHTDAELADFDAKMNDKSSDLSYDKDSEEMAQTLDGYDPEKVRAELDQEVETIFQEKTGEDGTPVEMDAETVKIKEEMERDTAITKIQEEYAKCRVI